MNDDWPLPYPTFNMPDIDEIEDLTAEELESLADLRASVDEDNYQQEQG